MPCAAFDADDIFAAELRFMLADDYFRAPSAFRLFTLMRLR